MSFNPRRTWDDERSSSVSISFQHDHHCAPGDLDYSQVNATELSRRVISCTVCDRVWRVKSLPSKSDPSGVRVEWWPYPCPGCGVNADICKHYGKRSFSKKGVRRA